ncbi:DUF6221 family protein [Streptomyces sp. NBC_01016]|uniref:DUF6221 family protein n=1 Tax=Streptomyces sp. NBC_01016 TaxID=2903720 RepID=UPI0022569E04|nr:DUF6221 family protein [Streptomyces sp. NBC_01016]MCX4827162.1 DUF6221 family protein [Streptomyces sp. NBC_01016]MCX4832349.1 DUF6221 family protein [Streptomyces sp. NBC_01016]
MDDLVRWLGAQLDEDERIARATLWDDDAALGSGRWRSYDRGPGFVHREARWVVIDGADEGVVDYRPQAADDEAVARHIAEHDPARVLREIDAKREILATVQLHLDAATSTDSMLSGPAKMGLVALRPVVKALASPYTERPGFLDEWRP